MDQKKLKSQYKQSVKRFYSWADWDAKYYPSLRNHWYRSFSTKQEKSCAEMHELEYRQYGLRVRPRRSSNLPDAWDDIPSSEVWNRKSWKKNSKRAHQYYKTKE